MHYDLRDSINDNCQRMLNALEPGTEMPIHRHRDTSEVVILLRGKVRWYYYDDEGNETQQFLVEATGETKGLCIPKGQWHSMESLETGSVIFETKEVPWTPLEDIDILHK